MRAGRIVSARMPPRCWFSATGNAAAEPSSARATITDTSVASGNCFSSTQATPPSSCHAVCAAAIVADAPLAEAVVAERAGFQNTRQQRCVDASMSVARSMKVDAARRAHRRRRRTALLAMRFCATATAAAREKPECERRATQRLRRHVFELDGRRRAAPSDLRQRGAVGVLGVDARRRLPAPPGSRLPVPAPAPCSRDAARHARTCGRAVRRREVRASCPERADVLPFRSADACCAPCRFARSENRPAAACSPASLAASSAIANSAAFAAPASPIANVATGMPFGICTIDSRLSSPRRYLDGIGTPSTGTAVFAASMPGRCAAPPAPAMIARRPRAAADSAYANISSGILCADSTCAANATPNCCSMSHACCITAQSESDPITTPTDGAECEADFIEWAARGSGARMISHGAAAFAAARSPGIAQSARNPRHRHLQRACGRIVWRVAIARQQFRLQQMQWIEIGVAHRQRRAQRRVVLQQL